MRRFERLTQEAREAPARERAARLREALQLWRGAPLADLAFESFAQTEARRLEELRLAALEDGSRRAGARHARRARRRLEALARENAARERLRRLQMLALYRAGRQVDALAAYQEARLALDELGLSRARAASTRADDPRPRSLARRGASERPERPFGTRPYVRRAGRLRAARRARPRSGARPRGGPARGSRCLAEAEAIVERHGGTVEQLFGEEIVAIFGVPVAHEDDALQAARAALREAIAPVTVRAGVVAGARRGRQVADRWRHHRRPAGEGGSSPGRSCSARASGRSPARPSKPTARACCRSSRARGRSRSGSTRPSSAGTPSWNAQLAVRGVRGEVVSPSRRRR